MLLRPFCRKTYRSFPYGKLLSIIAQCPSGNELILLIYPSHNDNEIIFYRAIFKIGPREYVIMVPMELYNTLSRTKEYLAGTGRTTKTASFCLRTDGL